MSDRDIVRPDELAASRLASQRRSGEGARAVGGRILTFERAKLIPEAVDYVDIDHGGLVVCGPGCSPRLSRLAEVFSGVMAEDPAAYEKQIATPEAPFDLPEGVLFGGSLDDALDQQRDRGAAFAVPPTRYVRAGDHASLTAIMEAVNALDRDDVVVTLPVAIEWLRDQSLKQLIVVIRAIPHPVALILGSQRDPLGRFTAALGNLRRLLDQAPGTGLWRTDLAGFDALARGAAFAAIGAGGSLRHLVPAGERTDSGGGPNYPTILVPEMLRFCRAGFLNASYADSTPPRCSCSRCGGAFLEIVLSGTDAAKTAAHAHNAASWNGWLPDFLATPALSDRQRWWRARCALAIDAHDTENARIGRPGRFEPYRLLKKWADS